MPTYEFLCATCGPFEQHRSLREASHPMACPVCQVVAQRVYSTSGVLLGSGAVHRRIEQGAEPRVVGRQVCEGPLSPRMFQQSAGDRPWQVGHAAQTPVTPGLRRL
jgi:putative FmdB family regulatory protein